MAQSIRPRLASWGFFLWYWAWIRRISPEKSIMLLIFSPVHFLCIRIRLLRFIGTRFEFYPRRILSKGLASPPFIPNHCCTSKFSKASFTRGGSQHNHHSWTASHTLCIQTLTVQLVNSTRRHTSIEFQIISLSEYASGKMSSAQKPYRISHSSLFDDLQ